MDEPKFMRRKVKAGLLEADLDNCAILVHYDVEATVLSPSGEPIVAKKTQNTKRIRLKTLSSASNLTRLAEDIIQKCSLVHASKLPRVEELLRELQAHQASALAAEARRRQQPAGGADATAASGGASAAADGESASIDRLDDYVERMYDDAEAATKATRMVAELSSKPTHLETIVSRGLLGLLARLLREEGRKSYELSLNCLQVLYSVSSYSQFHQDLVSSQVGSIILQHAALELKRVEVRKAERTKGSVVASLAGGGLAAADKLAQKRDRLAQRREDKLLYTCFHTLLNLAEDPEIERKMARKGIVPMILPLLARESPELRVLGLVFLKKLAIFKENLPALRKGAVVESAASMLGATSDDVVLSALRLLFNLSFDRVCRTALAASPAALSKLTYMLRKSRHSPLAEGLLYNISADDEGRAMLAASSEVAAALRKRLVACVEPQLPTELAALAINLALELAAAEAMASADGLDALLDRLVRNRDALALKLLRNLTKSAEVAAAAVPAASDLLVLLHDAADDDDLRVELLGLINNLHVGSLPDASILVRDFSLIEWMRQRLAPGASEDDELLEVVILAGELAASPPCAAALVESGIAWADDAASARSLYSLITEKQEDDEIVLQLLFAFYRLLLVEAARLVLLEHTQIVVYALDLLLDSSKAVREMASRVLDAVAESDERWDVQIRQRRFATHNREWLEIVDEDEAEEYEDALALSEAVGSLRINAPLDAAQLERGVDGAYVHSPGDTSASPGSADLDYDSAIGGSYGVGDMPSYPGYDDDDDDDLEIE